MPYEYRRMSEEERRAVVQWRREMGRPWHSPPHFPEQGGRFLITAACYDHQPLLTSVDRRFDFEGRLLSEMRADGVEVFGWVVLPNHYHVLVGTAALKIPLKVIQHVHGSTAREWNREDGLTGQRRVWYRCSDRMIRSESQFLRALNYVHYNPVKHGWIEDPYGWSCSSLGSYLESCGRQWLRETWRAYPPDDFGKEWDE